MVTCGPVPGAGGRTPGSHPKDRTPGSHPKDPGLPDADWSNDATSNDVDPLVSGFGQIYLTVKHICPVVLLSVLIFSKPTRRVRGESTGNPVVDGRGGLGAHGDSLDG